MALDQGGSRWQLLSLFWVCVGGSHCAALDGLELTEVFLPCLQSADIKGVNRLALPQRFVCILHVWVRVNHLGAMSAEARRRG